NGQNNFYESYSYANLYQSDVVVNVLGTGALYFGQNFAITANGNVAFNILNLSNSHLFTTGQNHIAGNLSYSNLVGGEFNIGQSNSILRIDGTIDIEYEATTNNNKVILQNIKNLTNGGSISLSKFGNGSIIKDDTLIVSNFSATN